MGCGPTDGAKTGVWRPNHSQWPVCGIETGGNNARENMGRTRKNGFAGVEAGDEEEMKDKQMMIHVSGCKDTKQFHPITPIMLFGVLQSSLITPISHRLPPLHLSSHHLRLIPKPGPGTKILVFIGLGPRTLVGYYLSSAVHYGRSTRCLVLVGAQSSAGLSAEEIDG